MPSRINHVALELAPDEAHPFGSRDIAYDVYLPLKRNGGLDAEAIGNPACRVRRRRLGAVLNGKIAVAEGGLLMFAYGNGTSQNCGCDHLLDGMALRAGQRISICDGAGDTHPFEVISIKET